MSKKEKLFCHLSCLLSVIHALGYIWHGYQTGFTICICAMILLDLLYVPAVIINRIKLLPYYLAIFGVALIFILAFTTSELYNNYSGLLCMFVAILVFPKYKNVFMAIYLTAAAVAFCVAKDPVYYLVIHTARAMWIFIIYDFVIYAAYSRKPVILYEEEKRILEQLCSNKLQKEIELDGYSESTIRRRIENAKSRNGLKTTEELKELYLKTYGQAE